MNKKLNRSAKIAILKSKGQAQDRRGSGIWGFSLNSRSVMLKLGMTWDEAISYCESKNWFSRYEKVEESVG